MASMYRSMGNICKRSLILRVFAAVHPDRLSGWVNSWYFQHTVPSMSYHQRSTCCRLWTDTSRCALARLTPYQQNCGQVDFRIPSIPIRCMSGGGKNFFSEFFKNIQDDMKRSKDMKENLKKFREEREKLEQSEAIQKARQKFESIEAETSKSSTAIKEKLDEVKDRLSEKMDEVQKTEFIKKSIKLGGELGRSAEKAAERISKHGHQLSQSAAFKNISEGVKAAKQEVEESTLSRARPYKAPAVLRKRSERSKSTMADDRVVEVDDSSTGVVLHKDSRWSQSWQSFKDNNEYVHKLFDLKVKYDESDHLMVRATRAFTEKIGYLFGGMFSTTEMSEVLTEICKIDPNFDKEAFVKMCHYEIIPNVLEAMIRADLDVLQDWCYEAPFNVMAAPIRQAITSGYRFDSKILDISNVDVAAGKIMEQGPVLVISFNSQQMQVVRDKTGKVVEGSEDKIIRMFYVWALCRDQEELDPLAAWKLLDISATSSEQWL